MPSSSPRSLLALSIVCILFAGGGLPLSGCAQDQDSSARSQDTAQVSMPPPSVGSTPTDTSIEADVPYVATPRETVEAMLELANVSKDDVVYDLGSGDGRIPIMAAQKYGARGVGIEIKPNLVRRARKNARLSGVSDRVEFRRQNIFKADFSDATVVTMYLFPEVNLKLRPMLFEQLDPGTRIISHSFDMNGWEPDTTVNVNGDLLYRWTIPEEIPASLKQQ